MNPIYTLTTRLQQITDSIAATREELAIGEAGGDPLDRMNAIETSAAAAVRLNRLKAEYDAVQRGIRRIEQNDRACESCGEQISAKRLAAKPEAALCIACQEAAEQCGRSAETARWEDVRL